MKSKSIPKWQRESVAGEMVGRATREEFTRIALEMTVLSERWRTWALGKHKAAFDSIPDAFLKTTAFIHASLYDDQNKRHHSNFFFGNALPEGEDEPQGFGGGERKVGIEPKQVSIPHELKMPDIDSKSISEAKLARDMLQNCVAFQEAMAKTHRLRSSIEAGLEKLITTKKLQETWPEAFDVWMDKHGETSDAPVPAVPVADIMTMINNFPDAIAAE